MYQSSSSSSSQKSLAPSGLVRYGSAPGSLLTTALDSVSRSSPTTINLNSTLVGHYYSGDSSSRLKSESTCTEVFSSNGPQDPEAAPLQTYGGSTSLLSQQSSPAGFFSQLTAGNGNEELVINGGRSYHQNSVAGATGFGMESSWGNSNCISFASPESRQAAKTPGGDDAFTCLNGLGTEPWLEGRI